jgi:WD40 repeat protein
MALGPISEGTVGRTAGERLERRHDQALGQGGHRRVRGLHARQPGQLIDGATRRAAGPRRGGRTIKLWPKEGGAEPVQLASGDIDGSINLWPKEGGAEPVVLNHGSRVWSLTVLPDARLASGGGDGRIKLWPAKGTGEPVVLTHGGTIQSLAVLLDGRLGSAGNDVDSVIKLWLVNEEKLIAALCLRAGRNLSKDEWARYMGDTPRLPRCRNRPSNWRTRLER